MLTIITSEDRILRQKAKRVAKVDDSIRNLCIAMITCCKENNGIGLAAPQVGISKQIIIVFIDNHPTVMINPEIVDHSLELCTMNEGCLSIPNEYYDLQRPKIIKVKYRDTKGKPHIETHDGMNARVILHEIDHLWGRLMTDMLTTS